MRQLSCSDSDLPIREPVVKWHKERKREAEKKGFELAKLTLTECVQLIADLLKSNPATIIIDALDECDRRHTLLEALDEIIQKSPNLVKVFVSSRDDDDIVRRLAHSPDVLIHASDNGEDIRAFVHFEVDRAIRETRLLPACKWEERVDLKHRIITTLTEGAQGMYVFWQALQLICR